MTKFSIEYADITTLKVEAIVNASNVSGLGCSIKNHCIDSAIHFAAGKDLLEACIALKGIPTTIAKITPAFNLPSKYVLHVTGPQKSLGGNCDFALLAKSYENTLDLARKHGLKQIAFCAISTGIFGFPKKQSAIVAIQTVQNWVMVNDENYKFDEIIFDCYELQDFQIYCDIFSKISSIFCLPTQVN